VSWRTRCDIFVVEFGVCQKEKEASRLFDGRDCAYSVFDTRPHGWMREWRPVGVGVAVSYTRGKVLQSI
jgi:hypothetical protein